MCHFRYQTHQLRNVSQDFCATINCYKYDTEDNVQWNMFDFVNTKDGSIDNFVPNADLSFKQMERIVMEEWDERVRSKTSAITLDRSTLS